MGKATVEEIILSLSSIPADQAGFDIHAWAEKTLGRKIQSCEIRGEQVVVRYEPESCSISFRVEDFE